MNRVYQHNASQTSGKFKKEKKKKKASPQIHELEPGVGSWEISSCNAGGRAAVSMRPEGLRKGKSPGASLTRDMG